MSGVPARFPADVVDDDDDDDDDALQWGNMDVQVGMVGWPNYNSFSVS